MLVGVLTGESLSTYHALTRLSPVQFIVPPVVWLSSPEENLPMAVVRHIEDEGTSVKVLLKPTMFRHLYNPVSKIPGYFAAMMPDNSSLSSLRHQLGIFEHDDPFIPSMMLCHDGMRSLATKQFCRGLSDALSNKLMVFEVFNASEDNPEHQTLFTNYNPAAQDVFGQSISYQ